MSAWWTFDEPAGPTANDIAGWVQNTGTYNGNPTPMGGKVRNALRFNGTTDFVQVPDQTEVNFVGSCTNSTAESFTIDAWIRADATGPGGVQTLLDKRSLPFPELRGYSLFLWNGNLGVQLADGIFPYQNYISSGLDLRDSQWHFIAVTVARCGPADNEGTLYVDGNIVHTFAAPHTGDLNNPSNLQIGRSDPAFGAGGSYMGLIDELEIFKRALSASELQAIFNAGSGGKCKSSSCVCDWTYSFMNSGGSVPELPSNVVTMNLTRDAQGCIGLDPSGQPRPFPYVWMAESNTGTMVRIRVDDSADMSEHAGEIMGRYRTAPDSVVNGVFTNGATLYRPNPSRTTVDRFGECWVGNRSDDNAPNGLVFVQGSVTRVGLVIGGTRWRKLSPGNYVSDPQNGQYLKPPFSYISPSVVDRDHDGYIHTAMRDTSILPGNSLYNQFPALAWAGAVNADTGAQSGADDELITNYTRVKATGVRALAVDRKNNLWVGGIGTTTSNRKLIPNQFIHKVSGASGNPLSYHSASQAYGALINPNNELWLVDTNATPRRITRWDLNFTPPKMKPDLSTPNIYGIGIDGCTGIVTTSTYNAPSGNFVRQFDTTGSMLSNIPGYSAQGLCVDHTGRAWVSRVWNSGTNSGVDTYDVLGTHVLSGTKTYISQDTTNTINPIRVRGSTGTAVDTNGNIWVSDRVSDSAIRIDATTKLPDLQVPLLTGSGPYNYSDKTGYIGISSTGAFGFLEMMHDSGCNSDPGKRWSRVTWTTQGSSGSGCTLKVYVRAADQQLSLGTKPWTEWKNGQGYCITACPGDVEVRGRYLQVRVEFQGPPGCAGACNLRLCSLRVECCPDSFPNDSPVQVAVNLGDCDGQPGEVIYVHNPGTLPVLVPLNGLVMTSFDSPASVEWLVDGVVVATQVTSGAVDLQHSFGDGIHEVTLRATIGDQISEATTKVEIGDHTPPVFVPVGLVEVANWSGVIPDFLATVQVSDMDSSGDPPLVLTQDTPAGTIVGQGLHEVVLTATDAGGNVAVEHAAYLVAPVVTLTSPSNYGLFPAGTAIPVSYTVAAGVTGITSVVLQANGTTVATLPGPGVLSSVTLAPGEYQLRVVAFGPGGAVSEGQEIGVTVLVNPYDVWAALFPGSDLTNPDADLDKDGRSNLEEYAFGLDPTLGWSVNPITVMLDKTLGTFRYTRRDPALTGISYTVWTSPDLSAWTMDPGAGQAVTGTDGDVQTVTVTLSAPPLTAAKLFVRMEAK